MANCIENVPSYDGSYNPYTGGYADGNNPQGMVTNSYERTANFGYTDWNYKEVNGVINSTLDPWFKNIGKEYNIDWRLIAAWCYAESRFHPNEKNESSTAGGIWQFTNIGWKEWANKDYKEDPDYVYRFQVKLSMDAFKKFLAKTINKFKNAASRKDQIALTIQSHHDGIISGTTWKNMIGNNHSYNNYLGSILDKYYSYCR